MRIKSRIIWLTHGTAGRRKKKHSDVFRFGMGGIGKICLVRRLEAQGLPPNQAYIIISTLTTFLNTNLDHLTQSVVSKSAINEFKAEQNSDLSQFKLKMKHMQDGHFNSVERKNEKLERDFKKLVIKLTNKFNREIIEVEAGLEAGKFELMKKMKNWREILRNWLLN
ncbi:uncharacterized protein LOC121981927 [Zingiber officinale]|uniref:uncharacterized protein LOC121981927 n=1 Tax=Zingiber officinale TaxID=94328 RepID=UPI001C4CB911|nr:uncharacterized protein LOC121981927 [Zingiber officinale]